MRLTPFVALALCACYTTVPLASLTPEPGTRVQVELTDQGSIDLAQYLGPRAISVNGRMLAATDSTLSLAVSQTTHRSGVEQFWKGETVELPRKSVATIRQRKVSVWRSGLVAGIAIAGATAIGSAAAGGMSGGGKGQRPPGGQK